jgi:hypothetical protein
VVRVRRGRFSGIGRGMAGFLVCIFFSLSEVGGLDPEAGSLWILRCVY